MTTRKHKWDHASERRFVGLDMPDGNARNERDCILCGITRITVIPPQGYPWHEWRTKAGSIYVGEATPPCVEVAQLIPLREAMA